MEDSINQVLQNLSYGMYAIGVNDQDRPSGCIVNTVIQVTNTQPIVALSMNRNNYTCDLIKKTGRFSVSVLSEGCDPAIIRTLGFTSGRNREKFTNLPYHLEDGLPVIERYSSAYITCEAVSMHLTNTHFVILGRVLQAKEGSAQPPMTYRYYHEVVKGKASPNAPTYLQPQNGNQSNQKEEATMSDNLSYLCTVCGYVYEGDLSQEPDDYVCPICGVGKDLFEKQD